MSDVRLQSPDVPTDGLLFFPYIISLPNSVELRDAIRGALLPLTHQFMWRQVGSMTEWECAWAISEAIMSINKIEWMLGLITPVWRDDTPDNILIADGSIVSKDDYPDLWEVTPGASKTASTIVLPDLRDRFIVGTGANHAEGSTGGEKDHLLTTQEMPGHTHTYTSPTFGVDIESVGVPDPTGVGNPPVQFQTSPTGGNQPHNNEPPYYAMRYGIIARLGT